MAASKKPAKKPAASKPAAKQPGVFDVSRPGKNHAAQASSKPIIVTNRPVIRDDVVTEIDGRQTAPTLSRPKKVVITPLNEQTSTVSIESEKPEQVAVTIAEPKPTVETTPVPVSAPDEPEPETEPVITDEAGKAVEVLDPEPVVAVPEAHREDKQLSVQQVEAAEQLAEERAKRIEKLIDSEEYFLPINAKEERRSRRVAIIGLILIIVLAIAWYNTALDAGLLPNMFNLPHTEFFRVKQ